MREEELAEIRARCEAATPGPWKSEDGWGVGLRYGRNARAYHAAGARGWPVLFRCQSENDMSAQLSKSQRQANCDFVARAREDVPALLKEIERLRTALAEVATLPAERADEAIARSIKALEDSQ